MNWKLRFQNPATLTALIAALVAFVYQVLSIMGITTTIDQSFFVQLGGVVVTLLVALGVIVDPTTAGIDDSARALTYDAPYVEVPKPKSTFSEAEMQEFFGASEKQQATKESKPIKYLHLWGRTIYWGTEGPATAKEGDIWINRLEQDSVYKYGSGKWAKTNTNAIIDED